MSAGEGYMPKTSRIWEKTKPDFQVLGQTGGGKRAWILFQKLTIQLHSKYSWKFPL
jgi:hypothetical protein